FCLESARIFHRKVHRKNHNDSRHNDQHQAWRAGPDLRRKALLFSCGFVFSHSVSVLPQQRTHTSADTLLNVIRRGRTSSLLFAIALAGFCAACGPGQAKKPDLPTSVSPGWKQTKMEAGGAPVRLPQSSPAPTCWRAEYAGEGPVTVWACGYGTQESALEAAQKMMPAAEEVKFHKGRYLIVVDWKNVSQANITTLIRAIQRSLPD